MIREFTIRLGLLAMVVPASLVFGPGCGALFPERENAGQQSSTGNDNTGDNTGTDPTPQGGAGLGFVCNPDAEAPCADPGAECVSNGGAADVHTCLIACDTQDGCPGGSRCTNSPEGRYCLRLCDTGLTCAGIHLSLICIPTGTEAVCWPKDNQGGELFAEADPVVAGLDVRRCGQPQVGCGEPGLPRPGTAAALNVQVRNEGALDIENATITLVAQSASVSGLVGETAKVGLLSAVDGLATLSASFAIAPTAAPGETLPFVVRVVGDGPGAEWNLPISLQLYSTTATAWVTETQLTQGGAIVESAAAGATTDVQLFAQNLGFEALAQVTADVGTSTTGATWTLAGGQAQSLPQMSNGVPQAAKVVASGTLTLPVGFVEPEVTLDVTLTDISGATWTQAVRIPVTP